MSAGHRLHTNENSSPGASSRPSVFVVMPAYNAAKTLAATHHAIPKDLVDEVILVDDHSWDDTVKTAHELNIEAVVHPHNVGYGGNQKTCYMEALRKGADVVVMLHPDGQYDPQVIPDITRPIIEGRADMVLGSRFLVPGGPLAGGMPLYKFVANRTLTTVENLVLGQYFSELHTGYRAYSRKFLETIPFLRNANGFVFDTQVIAQAVNFGMRIEEVPVPTKYFTDASSTSLEQSLVYGVRTLGVMLRYWLHRKSWLRAAIFLP
jgi:glycosyltransferase involved in cell wall biosynthesis